MDICGRAGRDVLGFIVENTHVTVTHLQISRLSLERIQNSTGEGLVKHEEKPLLHYSRPFNYLRKSDRQELFKAILHIRLMLSIHEKVTIQRKNAGTVDIFRRKVCEPC